MLTAVNSFGIETNFLCFLKLCKSKRNDSLLSKRS